MTRQKTTLFLIEKRAKFLIIKNQIIDIQNFNALKYIL